MTGLILLSLLLLVLSAFFSGAEIAFITANKLGVEIERDKGTPRSRIIASFYENPKVFLSAILVGNYIVLVLFISTMWKLLMPFLTSLISADWLRWTVLMLASGSIIFLFGEYIPKAIFRALANRSLFMVAYPMLFFQKLLRLPALIMLSISNFIIRYVLRLNINSRGETFTRLDLEDYVEGNLSGEHDEMEAGFFKNALQLKNVKARECMIPRTEIKHVDIADGLDALREVFISSRHSRILVTDGDIDEILGYVHHLSLLRNPADIRSIIIPVTYFPEVTSVMDMLAALTKQKKSVAVIVDEFGGTAGILTLEDITEEIFGEIEDEHDQDDYVDQQLSEDEFRFSGRLEIDMLNEKYPQLNFPIGDYETLSGYIVMTSGTIPEQEQEFELDDYKFTMEKVNDKLIEVVRVKLINSKD